MLIELGGAHGREIGVDEADAGGGGLGGIRGRPLLDEVEALGVAMRGEQRLELGLLVCRADAEHEELGEAALQELRGEDREVDAEGHPRVDGRVEVVGPRQPLGVEQRTAVQIVAGFDEPGRQREVVRDLLTPPGAEDGRVVQQHEREPAGQ